MLVYSIGIVLVVTIVSRTLYNAKRAVHELVIVYFFDVEFFSTSVVDTCYHSHIIHLGR